MLQEGGWIVRVQHGFDMAVVQSVHKRAETPTGAQSRSCSEHGIPDFGRPAFLDAKRSEFELTFPDPMHEFDPSDGGRGVSEPLQTEHGAQAKLDRPMILFKDRKSVV